MDEFNKLEKKISLENQKQLLNTLQNRFEENMNRHKGLEWSKIQLKLESNSEKLWSINEMEKTGGEPDVIAYNKENDEFTFCDCSSESPIGRRSYCYDSEALASRKENKPKNNVIDVAKYMGIEILSEELYRNLQKLGKFDTKTSSWIKTPPEIRKLGGAIFADFRYNTIFIYHNGAESYYAARAFRGYLSI